MQHPHVVGSSRTHYTTTTTTTPHPPISAFLHICASGASKEFRFARMPLPVQIGDLVTWRVPIFSLSFHHRWTELTVKGTTVIYDHINCCSRINALNNICSRELSTMNELNIAALQIHIFAWLCLRVSFCPSSIILFLLKIDRKYSRRLP